MARCVIYYKLWYVIAILICEVITYVIYIDYKVFVKADYKDIHGPSIELILASWIRAPLGVKGNPPGWLHFY